MDLQLLKGEASVCSISGCFSKRESCNFWAILEIITPFLSLIDITY